MEAKFKIKGDWNELKGKLKAKYPKLTDSDLAYSEGKEDEMLTRVEKRLGKSREEVTDIFNEMQGSPERADKERSTKTTSVKNEEGSEKTTSQKVGAEEYSEKGGRTKSDPERTSKDTSERKNSTGERTDKMGANRTDKDRGENRQGGKKR